MLVNVLLITKSKMDYCHFPPFTHIMPKCVHVCTCVLNIKTNLNKTDHTSTHTGSRPEPTSLEHKTSRKERREHCLARSSHVISCLHANFTCSSHLITKSRHRSETKVAHAFFHLSVLANSTAWRQIISITAPWLPGKVSTFSLTQRLRLEHRGWKEPLLFWLRSLNTPT